MSYFPENHVAALMVHSLRIPNPLMGSIPAYDMEVLREVLLGVVCPIVCVGHVNETGWHRACEATVDRAMDALRGKP